MAKKDTQDNIDFEELGDIYIQDEELQEKEFEDLLGPEPKPAPKDAQRGPEPKPASKEGQRGPEPEPGPTEGQRWPEPKPAPKDAQRGPEPKPASKEAYRPSAETIESPTLAYEQAPPFGALEPPADDRLSFEEILGELEKIVQRLEQGDMPLEESLHAFETGMILSKQAMGILNAAEQRVEILLKDGSTEPFERKKVSLPLFPCRYFPSRSEA